MFFKKWLTLFGILDESPFFMELSLKEREKLVRQLLQEYPGLDSHQSRDMDIGYEASWHVKHSR